MSNADVADLARKYRCIAELRRARAESPAFDPPLGSLAKEFPGALRELDALPLEVIEARRAALEAAQHSGAIEPWMEWMAAYHALLRAALFVKRLLAGRREVSQELAEAIRIRVHASTGVSCSERFVAAVARPPGGRLTQLIILCLAESFAVDPFSLRELLLPQPPRAPSGLARAGELT